MKLPVTSIHKYDNVEDYFHMKEENRRIHKMNDSLMNLLPCNFIKVDTGSHVITDSVRYDTRSIDEKIFG